jgi:broad specificity phosphatase PhoE
MSRIYVVRHGESIWNAERRWTGHGDPPLSEGGRAQARDACERLRGERFDAVCSSRLARARETATILASALGLRQLEAMRELDERFAGEMSGMTSAEIEERWPGLLDRWRAGSPPDLPGGERWETFVARVREGLRKLESVPGRILLVSHMGVQRVIEHALGKPPRWYGNLEGLWVDARW